MRTLTCHCEQTFKVDLPELVNLDSTPDVIAQIADGSFLTCICPTCGAELHTDLKTRLDWPSKKTSILLIPEIDRLAWLSGALETDADVQVTIGFAELADRVAVLGAGLSPLAVEAIKYHLTVKARDASPDVRPIILFDRLRDSGDLEFRIHGLKQNEVALTVIPQSLYRSILEDASAHPENEPYASLTNGAYISVQNILLEDDPNA